MLQCGCLNGSLFSSALSPPLHFASLWIKWMHGTVFTQGKIPTEKQGQGLVSLIIDNHLGWCVSLGCLVGEKVLYDDVNVCLKLHFAPVRVELEW